MLTDENRDMIVVVIHWIRSARFSVPDIANENASQPLNLNVR